MIIPPCDIPLKQFPTSAQSYKIELQDWLQSLANQGFRYTGSISKTVGKQTFTVHTFTEDNTVSEVLVMDASLAGIVNFPSSEKSLANSASSKFTELAQQGYYYSGSFFKKISTSNYTYLVFYRHSKSKTGKTQTKSS